MKGSYKVTVQNSIVQFKFSVNRNITILRGDSATGKSTLVEMVREYSINGPDSGINISCEKECTVLNGNRWQSELQSIKNSIVFIDEGFPFLSSSEFSEAIRKTNNYYVIATRESLFNLPYSIREIYGLKNVTRKSKFQEYDRLYTEFFPLYNDEIIRKKPDVVIVEDSNAGYDFFKSLCDHEGISCISSKGKSNIYKTIKKFNDEILFVVADGAAFGPELERVMYARMAKNAMLFLPESFEWLILRSGLIDGDELQDVLRHPEDFIESERYYSWERFFTALLVDETKDTYLKYSKAKLNKNYLNPKEMSSVISVIEEKTKLNIVK